jgi:hypothetical protein
MSRDLLIPARAAPACVRQLEVPGSAEPFRHAAGQIAEQKTLNSNVFRCLQSESMTVTEDSQRHAFPRLARPGNAELSLHFVGKRIDWQSSPLRFAQHRDGQEVEIDRSA